jgi:hypothetical protein
LLIQRLLFRCKSVIEKKAKLSMAIVCSAPDVPLKVLYFLSQCLSQKGQVAVAIK